MPAVELWSVVASVVSVILGLLAIGLSVRFFIASKNVEAATGSSLTKIETQADMLQRLTGRQLERLTKYVTQQQPAVLGHSMAQAEALTAISKTLASLPLQVPANEDREKVLSELISCYVGLYFYVAQLNYWAQGYLPEVSLFDDSNPVQNLAKNAVDTSYADFVFLQNLIEKTDQEKLKASPLAHLLEATKAFWKDQVRSSVDVFRQKAKEGQ